MNQLLLSAGLQLLNTVLDKKEGDTKHVQDWKKEEIVTEIMSKVDEARPFWARKTFWFAMIGFAVPIVNKVAGLDMQIEEVSAAITPLVAFILGESWRKKNS